jgi:glycosyltransferase involved in cell wall biosynthesis
MSAPLLSVCLITYNHGPFIRQALNSVAMQKVNFPMELVIADDCSTDNTREIVEGFIKNYSGTVHYIRQDRNIGPAANFIGLLSAAKGKYIAYIEGDDYWIDKYKLQRQVDFLEQNDAFSLCFHDIYTLQSGKRKRGANWDAPDTSDLNFLLSNGNYISSLSVVFRNLPEITGFLNKMRSAPFGDYLVYIVCAMKGKLKFFPERMGIYRVHKGGAWSEQDIDITYKKIMYTTGMLYNALPESYKPLLQVQYLKTLEKFLLLQGFAGNSDVDISPLLIPQMNIPESVIEYIRFTTQQKTKPAHYIKSVPAKILMQALRDKLKNR